MERIQGLSKFFGILPIIPGVGKRLERQIFYAYT